LEEEEEVPLGEGKEGGILFEERGILLEERKRVFW
jgi:hypothetical protein